LQACARLMASELRWNENRVREEIDEATNEFRLHHSSLKINAKGPIHQEAV